VPEFIQIPADLPITFVGGDELNIALEIKSGSPATAVDLTGYTLEAKVIVPAYQNPGGELSSGAYTVGSVAATFTVSAVNLASGRVNIGLTESQTAALSAATGYRWYFRWQNPSGVTLTVVSGTFTVRIP